MANETLFSGHTDTIRIAAVLSKMVHEQLTEQADLRAVVKYWGSVTGSGSDTIKVQSVLYDDAMVSVAEASAAANNDITSAGVDILVARYALARSVSDLFQLTKSQGSVGLEEIARAMVIAARKAFINVLVAAFGDLTATAGTASTALTVDDVYDAMDTLRQSKAQGPFAMVLSAQQYGNFVESLRGEGQSIHPEDSANLLGLKQGVSGFQGVWNGLNIFVADETSNDGADGAVFDIGCFGYADGAPAGIPGDVAMIEQALWVELDRNAKSGLTDVVGNYYFGLSLIEAARGVKMLSGA